MTAPAMTLDPAQSVIAGTRIRELRKARGLSQQEFARIAGLLQPRVSLAETGTRRTPLRVLGRLAEVLGVEPASLLAECGHCHGQPPAGYSCLTCGAGQLKAPDLARWLTPQQSKTAALNARALIAGQGRTQKEIAARAGMCREHFGRMLKGEMPWRESRATAVAELLGTTLHALTEGPVATGKPNARGKSDPRISGGSAS